RADQGGDRGGELSLRDLAALADHSAQRSGRSRAGRVARAARELNVKLQSALDQHTGPWGVKVAMVEVKQVDLPDQMIRAIARQAEAERERRAKIIHAE